MMDMTINEKLSNLKAPNREELRKTIKIIDEKQYLPIKGLREGLILDLGAHVGVVSKYYSQIFKTKNIIAVEPNPNSYQYLVKNLSDLYYEVCTINAAIVVTEADCYLYTPSESSEYYGRSWGNSLIKNFWEKEQNTVPIRIFPLDYKTIFSQRISLCKIDVEGYEFKLLKALQDSHFVQSCSYYIVEFHYAKSNTQEELDKIIKGFKELGYEIFCGGKKVQSLIHVKKGLDTCHIFRA